MGYSPLAAARLGADGEARVTYAVLKFVGGCTGVVSQVDAARYGLMLALERDLTDDEERAVVLACREFGSEKPA